MQKQFKILCEGMWFDLFHSEEDIKDKTPILKENGDLADAFAELDEGTPVYNLEQAKAEAKLQFYGKVWTLSNGLISFTKGDKAPKEVTEEIFGKAKETMPTFKERACIRRFDGELVYITAKQTEQNPDFRSSDQATNIMVANGLM